MSYRREDSAGYTGRISDRLGTAFGQSNLFLDVDNIPLGVDFVQHLHAEVARSDVLLAVIGPKWLDSQDKNNQRRIYNLDDPVRIEIGAALQRNIPVIPILLDGTKMPEADLLPEDIKKLSLRHGIDLRYSSFHADMSRLVRQLKAKRFSSPNRNSTPLRRELEAEPTVQQSRLRPPKRASRGSSHGERGTKESGPAPKSNRQPSAKPLSFNFANAEYEKWLCDHCDVLKRDLAYKHRIMRRSPSVFFRATYFRWAQQIEQLCPELKEAPKVLSVGDAHTDNFGTWRDALGRLVWGVYDFDETATIAYPYDLIRLATSVRLTPKSSISNRDTAAAIVKGYRDGLQGPSPAMLDEQSSWMRPYAIPSERDQQKFWAEVASYPKASPPANIASSLRGSLPNDASQLRFASRVKGPGGSGRPRYLAIATWRGGRIALEAKALVPSAWYWAHGEKSPRIHFLDLANGKYRSPDPYMTITGGFIFRRIAADSRKINLGDDAGEKLRTELLWAMGFDIGAIHAATNGATVRISRDLNSREADWLHAAAKTAAAAVTRDFHSAQSPSRSG